MSKSGIGPQKRSSVGMLVGITFGIFVAVIVVSGMFSTGIVVFKSHVATDSELMNEENIEKKLEPDYDNELSEEYCDEITGDYVFNEVIPGGGDVNGVTSASYEYKLSVVNYQNNCNATLEVNGLQTFNKIKMDVQYVDEHYNFLFDTYADGDQSFKGNSSTYTKGDILFNLYNEDDELYTHWNKFVPKVDANKVDGVYFKIDY